MSGCKLMRRSAAAFAVWCTLCAAARARVEDPSGGGRPAGIAAPQAAGTRPTARADAAAFAAAHGDAGPVTAAPSNDGVRQALGMLEYVASDYDNAVGDRGVVLDPFEYEEQKQFLIQIADLLAGAAPPASRGARRDLQSIRSRVLGRRTAADVVPRLRALHARLVREFDIRLTPQQVPSLAAGRILFEESCAVCHGSDGRAQTQRARELHPHPVDFHSRDLEARLSPYLAFSVVTFGVPGTAMAGFPTLTEEERWDLAFFVCALRHEPPARAAHTTVAQATAHAPVALTLADLARATDASLRLLLGGLPASAQAAQLARWRWVPPLDTGTSR